MSSPFTALYPVVAVENPAESGAAMRELGGLEPVFEEDWYVHLVDGATGRQVGFVRYDHVSVPKADQTPATGLFITMDAEDVAAVWEEKKNQIDVVHPLTDEVWGQRHFICRIPGGVLVDVVQMLEG